MVVEKMLLVFQKGSFVLHIDNNYGEVNLAPQSPDLNPLGSLCWRTVGGVVICIRSHASLDRNK